MENLEKLDHNMDKIQENLQNISKINAKKLGFSDKKRYYCAACNAEIGEGDHICGNCKRKMSKF